MKSIHPKVPYFQSIKNQFSWISWQWGVATYFVEKIPFEYSTSRLFADQLTHYYLKTLPKDQAGLPHQHLYEFGAGMGMLAKHVIEALNQKAVSYGVTTFTLHVSEYSQAQIDDINRYGFLKNLNECAQLELISALDPEFSPGVPNWIYLSYIVAALPTRQICVQDGIIYERYIGAELPDDAIITNATIWPPKVLNVDEIIDLVTSEDKTHLHHLIPIIAPLIKETEDLIPLDELTDYTPDERQLLIDFVAEVVPKKGNFKFNYPYQWIRAMDTMMASLAPEASLVLHDFGFTELKQDLTWTELFGHFGSSQYTAVCFPLLKWAASRQNLAVNMTTHPQGNSQMMAIYKGSRTEVIGKVFNEVWSPNSYMPRAHNIVEEIWSTKTENPIMVTPEIAENWSKELPPIERHGYSINAHIASALYHYQYYDEAITYAERALTDYAQVGISALIVIARSYLKKEDIENAKKYFQKIVEISPMYSISYCELAKIALAENNLYDYLTLSKKWMMKDYFPLSWPLILNMATAAYQIADYDLSNLYTNAVLAAYAKAPNLIGDTNKSKAKLIQKAVQSISFIDAKDHNDLMTPLLDNIVTIWKELQGADGIEKIVQERRDEILNGKNKGIIVLDGRTPVGITWIESVGLHYGNITYHTIHPEYETHLVKASIDARMFANHWLHELIRFKETAQYRPAIEYFGIQTCTRDRMVIYMDQYNSVEIIEPRVTFKTMTIEDAPIVSEMAYQAHLISQDQTLAYDMATREGRVELEKAFFKGIFGTPILEATSIAYLDGAPVGYYSVVEVKCWGYEHVPWIFDIGVTPAYQGMGLGKILLANMLNTLKKDPRFELVGLAVTQTNLNAIHIYTQFGFQKIGEFDEFGYAL